MKNKQFVVAICTDLFILILVRYSWIYIKNRGKRILILISCFYCSIHISIVNFRTRNLLIWYFLILISSFFRLKMRPRILLLNSGLCILTILRVLLFESRLTQATYEKSRSVDEDSIFDILFVYILFVKSEFQQSPLEYSFKGETLESEQTFFNYKRNRSHVLSTPSKPVFAIGILSRESSVDKRKSIRKTWLSQIRFASFDIKHQFIIDRLTEITREEQKLYGDIVYTNMSAALSGYAICFSTRMLFWFKYAVSSFPKSELIAKMDDDVYPCFPNLFERICRVRNKTLYYGWKHGGSDQIISSDTRVDEMFVVVGRELVDRIVKRKYCGCFENTIMSDACNKRNSKEELISHGFADMALGEWLSVYNDNVIRVSDNRYIRHFSYLFVDRMENHKYAVPQFCLKNYIFHKSSIYTMYKLYHYNMYFRTQNRIAAMSNNSDNYRGMSHLQ